MFHFIRDVKLVWKEKFYLLIQQVSPGSKEFFERGEGSR